MSRDHHDVGIEVVILPLGPFGPLGPAVAGVCVIIGAAPSCPYGG